MLLLLSGVWSALQHGPCLQGPSLADLCDATVPWFADGAGVWKAGPAAVAPPWRIPCGISCHSSSECALAAAASFGSPFRRLPSHSRRCRANSPLHQTTRWFTQSNNRRLRRRLFCILGGSDVIWISCEGYAISNPASTDGNMFKQFTSASSSDDGSLWGSGSAALQEAWTQSW